MDPLPLRQAADVKAHKMIFKISNPFNKRIVINIITALINFKQDFILWSKTVVDRIFGHANSFSPMHQNKVRLL